MRGNNPFCCIILACFSGSQDWEPSPRITTIEDLKKLFHGD